MEYCTNCGHSIDGEAQFCTNCGMKVLQTEQIEKREQAEQPGKMEETGQLDEAEAIQQTEQQNPVMDNASQNLSDTSNNTQNNRQSKNKSPFFKSKLSKFITIAIFIILLLLGGSYYVLDKFIFSPEVVADQFISAIEDENVTELRTLINEGQSKMEATKEDVERFLNYLEEHPKIESNISRNLKQKALDYAENSSDDLRLKTNDDSLQEAGLVNLHKDGKKGFIFDQYVVSVIPMYIGVEIEDFNEKDDITLFINDEKGKKQEKEAVNIGPLLPGVYNVKATMEGEYGEIAAEKQVDFSDEGPDVTINLALYTNNYVDVYSDNADATLYVNGESTKQKINDLSGNKLGPIPKDGSIEVYAQKKFSTGTKKSNVVQVEEDTHVVDLYLNYDEYDAEYEEFENEDEVEETITSIVEAHYEGITSRNYAEAYDLFSVAKKGEYSLDTWKDGLKNTLEDEVYVSEVKNITDDDAEAYIEMTSYEEDGDDVVVTDWKGYLIVIKENGAWKIDKAKIDKIDSRIE